MSVAKAQKHAARGGKTTAKKKRLGFSQRDSSPWELPDDAPLRLGQIMLHWVIMGGYVGMYQTSDGGAVGILFKMDGWEDEKVYVHGWDDFDEFEQEFWNANNTSGTE